MMREMLERDSGKDTYNALNIIMVPRVHSDILKSNQTSKRVYGFFERMI